MKKSLYVLLCAAALVSCGQPKQQQKAVADVVTSGNPIFEGWYADPEGIIYGDTYWVFPTWSDAYEKQTYFDCFSSKDLETFICARYLRREMGEESHVGAVYHP